MNKLNLIVVCFRAGPRHTNSFFLFDKEYRKYDL